MTEDSNHRQRSKLSALISGGEQKKVAGGKASPLTRLPRKTNTSSLQEELPNQMDSPTQKIASVNKPSSAPNPPVSEDGSRERRFHFGPAFWTITGILSLIVNAILIAILLGLYFNVGSLQLGGLLDMGNGLLGGLYSNFELMDRAHITTTIPVESTIPVKFDLLLNQQTNVVLSQDVTIERALVTLQTGGLNITRAPTTITLPQGTTLPVVLNLTVPVDTTVPVVLNVPVDIALANTDLHVPFTGLQEVVRPFYCLINKSAVNLDGVPICQ
jgi:hypothetical protein